MGSLHPRIRIVRFVTTLGVNTLSGSGVLAHTHAYRVPRTLPLTLALTLTLTPTVLCGVLMGGALRVATMLNHHGLAQTITEIAVFDEVGVRVRVRVRV